MLDRPSRLIFPLRLVVISCLFGSVYARGEPPREEVDFNRDVRPILAENCYACHGFDEAAREADLRLDTFAGAIGSDGGNAAIVPGEPDESELIARVLTDDADQIMPPADSGKRLSDAQRDILRRWVQQGANYETHWAFVPPQRSEPPLVEGVSHPIDRFIQARLASEGISPSPRADSQTLIRRLSLDLTGLPPTPEQVDTFITATAADPDAAYQELTERLLASPHYGERWALWWLDQARYADSNGYSVDAPRQIWAYRDWVIDAFNQDMPFDTFTIEQLAGDLLPEATESQKIATGFHRNTQINQEGGIDKEQFRIDSVFDRVATTGTVWLGLTIGCAQCHDHKFDPISQVEYYQMFAFLNNQDEPAMKVYGPEGDPSSDKPLTTTLVMRERGKPRDTHLLIKGDFTRPAQPVTPATPSILHPLERAAERAEQPPNRLDLANWIVSPNNPLTARVIVNRLWQQYFGRGLAEIENDFGLQGSTPSHPELLDWLALEFIRQGWSIKDMQRLIVSSRTYQQASRLRPELSEKDPDNYLLGRQRRLRLDAEIVRDTLLAACGLLSPKLGGPPVYPPIPNGVMGQGQVKRAWKTSTGEDRYRRGIYTFKFRATPPPALSVFDAPDGFSTCTRRLRSNTPLQALTLMNDPAHVEFATAIEKIILSDGLETAFRRCTSRTPTAEELAVLARLDSLSAARTLLNLDETITRE
ncbi:PSD1 and planctomycete cytochrome C domain-containing protein [Roseimaritima ulvae]|uniref:Planctomycete cytochrome C n=1 Tax=Roseimaritima ulvae TaxID=980254 RepID=A0A5B9QYW9_9BACT|nr:PSD1 and planctomycete cytochrome C domain-containing protein [Roseimaritima ulvae]QEG42605.1 Planctomycete cytochrome C [Roseimaritima ulvae]